MRLLRTDPRVRYLVVGGLNTAIGLGVFAAVYHVAGDRIGYVGTLVATYAVAILIGFELQRRLVFDPAGEASGALPRYAGVQLGALATNSVVLPFLVEIMRLPVLPAQVVSLVLTIVATYGLHRRFTFRESPVA